MLPDKGFTVIHPVVIFTHTHTHTHSFGPIYRLSLGFQISTTYQYEMTVEV